MNSRHMTAVLAAFIFVPFCLAEDPKPLPPALQDYIAKPQPKFAWTLEGSIATRDGNIHEIMLTSQEWQGIVWKHPLYIYEPANITNPSHCLLFVTGGSNGSKPKLTDLQMGQNLAKISGSCVATLHQVPNQPLLGNHVEDDLITETFLKYLKTKDASWPLLFPMVNSAVKAMDAIQQFSEKERKQPIKSFVVTGASKRGWTTWLSAVVDKRIVGIAPIVIDTLNFRPQMKHQMDTWGKYSEQIDDYSSKGLIDLMEKEPNEPLWKWVDPYTYRKDLKLPKLIVNGANDRYWVVDALNIYWDGLEGSKRVMYVPNGGHGLDGGQEKALATIAVFSKLTAIGKEMPKLVWEFSKTDKGRRLALKSDIAPKQALLWTAKSPTKDFRPAKWMSSPMKKEGEYFVGIAEKPDAGHYAVHGAMEYLIDKVPVTLSSQIQWE